MFIYVQEIKKVAKDLLLIDDIMSSRIHVGNCDIVAEFVYEITDQLMSLILKVKESEDIDRVVWSSPSSCQKKEKHDCRLESCNNMKLS